MSSDFVLCTKSPPLTFSERTYSPLFAPAPPLTFLGKSYPPLLPPLPREKCPPDLGYAQILLLLLFLGIYILRSLCPFSPPSFFSDTVSSARVFPLLKNKSAPFDSIDNGKILCYNSRRTTIIRFKKCLRLKNTHGPAEMHEIIPKHFAFML